jgi:RimJ/RimL family protein N-acetyltransferase
MAYGLEGDFVRLVPLDHVKHFENYLIWLNDDAVTRHLLVEYPMNRLMEQEFFDMQRNNRDEIIWAIETLDGRHIGSSGVHKIDFRHLHCITGSFIGDPEFQGKGLGTDAARVRAKYLFETLNMHRVYSAYLGDNERSRRMQERIGAVETGRFPERYFRDGKYLDEVIMTLTREAWLANLK